MVNSAIIIQFTMGVLKMNEYEPDELTTFFNEPWVKNNFLTQQTPTTKKINEYEPDNYSIRSFFLFDVNQITFVRY